MLQFGAVGRLVSSSKVLNIAELRIARSILYQKEVLKLQGTRQVPCLDSVDR
jgi:hypothetical protein